MANDPKKLFAKALVLIMLFSCLAGAITLQVVKAYSPRWWMVDYWNNLNTSTTTSMSCTFTAPYNTFAGIDSGQYIAYIPLNICFGVEYDPYSINTFQWSSEWFQFGVFFQNNGVSNPVFFEETWEAQISTQNPAIYYQPNSAFGEVPSTYIAGDQYTAEFSLVNRDEVTITLTDNTLTDNSSDTSNNWGPVDVQTSYFPSSSTLLVNNEDYYFNTPQWEVNEYTGNDYYYFGYDQYMSPASMIECTDETGSVTSVPNFNSTISFNSGSDGGYDYDQLLGSSQVPISQHEWSACYGIAGGTTVYDSTRYWYMTGGPSMWMSVYAYDGNELTPTVTIYNSLTNTFTYDTVSYDGSGNSKGIPWAPYYSMYDSMSFEDPCYDPYMGWVSFSYFETDYVWYAYAYYNWGCGIPYHMGLAGTGLNSTMQESMRLAVTGLNNTIPER